MTLLIFSIAVNRERIFTSHLHRGLCSFDGVKDVPLRGCRGGEEVRARNEGINFPSQYWHLIHSWSNNSEEDATFGKSIQCGELIFWMAEVSGVLSQEELASLADDVLREPKNRRRGNKLIQDACFDKIVAIVEGACPAKRG